MAEETKVGEARAGFEPEVETTRSGVRRLTERSRGELLSRLPELAAKFSPDPCTVCGGEPLASGRRCVCGGKGTHEAEVAGLRLYALELEDELARSRAALSAAERYVRAKRKAEAFNEMWWNGTPSQPDYSPKARRIYYKWDERKSEAWDALAVAVDELRRARGEAEKGGEG